MKSTGIVRLVDELGRIVLPIELRRVLELEEGDPVEFFYDDEKQSIMIRKYRAEECLFCKGTVELRYFKERFICAHCITSMGKHKEPVPEPIPEIEVKRVKRKDTMQRLLTAMQKFPHASQKELAAQVGISQGRVSQLIKELT
ncbi:AbrB/MazE/SpoVT family DNA-binding domain-containing protein [Paenibacillus senegalensis]|uniref:AbrB/MazE/SpoVT family DNA-binding domain-containing protein n=1 Tax=Paenibacillus senegalensis TaxID=1465766 RepID=UPI00028A2071|nr:AbrB/MazE/SpoVT family DNA-binding domain-containing protein [Paenibacillus senegalensis]